MNLRRVVLDVDKAVARPSLLEIAEAISAVAGVEALNITVKEIDIETLDLVVIIEGEHMDYPKIVEAIESTGAVVHSIDQLVAGSRLVEYIKGQRS